MTSRYELGSAELSALRAEHEADHFHDECGVFGIQGHDEAAHIVYLGLYALQHRGQESCGIVASNGKEHTTHRAMGLVADTFNEKVLARIEGRHAIGHVRYSTAGESHLRNAQPIFANTDGGPVSIAHNGNLVNASAIRKELEGRGAIYSEALTALRASFGRREPVFEGEHFSFSDFIIDPCGVQQSVPIWLGGRTARSLRRALAAADGWTPFSLGSDEVADMLAQARGLPEWKERTAPFDVALGPAQQADVTQPDGVERLVDGVASAAKAGASVINLGTRSTSLAHYLDQLETIAARVMPRFSDSGN